MPFFATMDSKRRAGPPGFFIAIDILAATLGEAINEESAFHCAIQDDGAQAIARTGLTG